MSGLDLGGLIRTATISALAWCALIASGAQAKVVAISDARFHCSAGDGKFARADIVDAPGGRILSGRVRFLDGSMSTGFASAGAIVFNLEEGGITGAFLTIVEGEPESLEIVIKRPGAGKNKRLIKIHRDSWASLTVSLDENDVLTVSSGEHSRRVKLDNPKIVGRQIHCQSGTFEFDMRPEKKSP